ncbi:malate dehydrogenase (quinone) [Cellulomonas endophytica]|uniref:malate dehydrogenase (quinone) n=1 Tax=Cellulomonas endophytica TaxID=2494735 RepID=UPI0023EA6246|nr:malate dehydrogenase (quinone) [Cellulomonas endophytica]
MTSQHDVVDVALVGGGIMSATLGAILATLEPSWTIRVLEREAEPATESSNAWNNAGTGHAALCELNYTPEGPGGTVDISKAVVINDEFRLSRELWDRLERAGRLPAGSPFLSVTPHMTFVRGRENVEFLRRRHDALRRHPSFARMEFSDDPKRIAAWAPLVMEGRVRKEPVAATFAPEGTDVDYGALTRLMLDDLVARGGRLETWSEVTKLKRRGDGWRLTVADKRWNGSGTRTLDARFVFVGAGGGALHLLQKSGIREAQGYAGFPISGQFLRTTSPDLTSRHHAKVYGKADIGAPPMSVPHLDTRVVDGRPSIMFGPYAGWSMKFLKGGSWTDLLTSIRPRNLWPMVLVGLRNVGLLKYLISEVTAGEEKRLQALRAFMPTARGRDWELITAGQRVQVIAPDGVLKFGTELITAADGSIAGLLGASPGASTAVATMVDLLHRCFPERLPAWTPVLHDLMPTLAGSSSGTPSVAGGTGDQPRSGDADTALQPPEDADGVDGMARRGVREGARR